MLGGYSPYGALTLFQTLNELHAEYVIHAKSPEQELSELAVQSLKGYFRSHPPTSDRLAQMERVIAEEHWQDRTAQRPFHVEYEVHNNQLVKPR